MNTTRFEAGIADALARLPLALALWQYVRPAQQISIEIDEDAAQGDHTLHHAERFVALDRRIQVRQRQFQAVTGDLQLAEARLDMRHAQTVAGLLGQQIGAAIVRSAPS